MSITKPNDMFVATLNNPGATTFDLMTLDLSPENTGLLSREEYKQSQYIKDNFTLEDGKFDDSSFDIFYNLAATHYGEMSSEEYLKNLETVEYSPFDLTRPKESKTFSVSVEFAKDYNPFKQIYGRTGLYSIEDSDLSLRELAQQEKVFDTKTNTWSEKSANDLNIFSKFFGDTLVYAQWDEEGIHVDPATGRSVTHKKGDWKINQDGNLYLETLGNREVYGKQVVNPTDMLTTDGSFANQFDFFDSDSKEKSIAGTVFKTIVEIAPFLIPTFTVAGAAIKVGQLYGGVRAAVGMASALPTFYKGFEGMLLGESRSPLNKGLTQVENYLSKFNQTSVSDEGQANMFNFEQVADMVGSIFSQIHEQRAMASLSKVFYKGEKSRLELSEKYSSALKKVQMESFEAMGKNKLDPSDFKKISDLAISKIPELKSLAKKQSQLAKSLSLGYMALTSTSDIYGEALESGYDRRTAGFAAMAALAGQYGIMMNNRMGDWFLDKTTGYTQEANRAMMIKSVKPWLKEIQEAFSSPGTLAAKKTKLASSFAKFKNGLEDLFLSPSELAENLWKNALIEGIEEVTEQAVLDTTKGMIDTLSYLGLTAKKGSFGGWDNVFSQTGLETYLSNLLGGILGGAMFEFERSHLSKIIDPKSNAIQEDTRKSLYELVASGYENDIISYLNKQRGKFGNSYISPVDINGVPVSSEQSGISQADVITDSAIEMVKRISGVLDTYNLKTTDDDILRRAILDDIVIKDLEKYRTEGKNVGIEGLVLDEYKVSRDKIVNIGIEIKNAEEKGEDVKFLKQELKIHTDKLNDILEGKNSGIYFDKMMLLLDKSIAEPFLSMDKQSYTKNTYDVDYNDLQEEGLGLSKKRIDSEWTKMIEGKELIKHLDTVTKAYLDWEQQLNLPIADYTESGYSIERAEVYKNVIDLNNTLRLFNTSGTAEEKRAAIERYIEINNHFKKLGVKTILPWDIYKTTITDDLIKEKLVKKTTYELNDQGEYIPVESDYTPEELNSPELKSTIEDILKTFPINPLDINLGINSHNSVVNDWANKNIEQLKSLELNPNKTESDLEKIAELKNSLSFPRLTPFENSEPVKDVERLFLEKRVDMLQKHIKDNDLGDLNVTDVETSLNELNAVLSNQEIDVDLSEKVEISEDGDIELKSSAQSFVEKMMESGALLSVIYKLRNSTSEDQVKEFLDELKDISSRPDSEIEQAFKDFIEKHSSKFISAIEEYNRVFKIKFDEKLIALNSEINKLNEKQTVEIEKAKPEFFKLRNYSFEFLIKHLESGIADEEIWLEAKKLSDEQKKIILEKVLSGKTNDFDVVNEILNNPDLFQLGGMVVPLNELSNVPEKIMEYLINSNVEDSEDAYNNIEYVLISLKDYKKEIELINRFESLSSSDVTLKKNPLYNFIREFSLSLNSNSKTAKVIDILEREDKNLSQASSVNNFISDNIREKDIMQTIAVLKIVKVVVNAMSTTEISYGNPVGFIKLRQDFAKRNKVDSDIANLKTISSDIANLMSNDVDRLINKLEFIKQLSENNSGRLIIEQEIIRKSMDEIFLENWKSIIKKLPLSILPPEKFNEIANSNLENDEKLMQIEDLFFETNKNKKEQALSAILSTFGNIDPTKSSKIDRDVSISKISNWDIVLYMISTLVVKGSDWAVLNYRSLDTFDKAPFYTQELAARIVRASTINPLLFSEVIKRFYNNEKEDASFITFVLGGAGTGKTTAVFGLNLDHFRVTNDKSIIRVTAPTDIQTNNLDNSIKNAVGEDKLEVTKLSKHTLYEQLGITKIMLDIENELKDLNNSKTKKELEDGEDVPNKTNKYVSFDSGKVGAFIPESFYESVNFKNLPNLVLIDEVTHFSFAELHILNEISKRSYLNDETNFMKIIAAGDPNQLGYFIESSNNYFTYNVNAINGIFTPKLWTTVRSTNNQKRVNGDFLIGLVETISEIYNNVNDRESGNKIAKEYISKNRYVLDWYQDEKSINGDVITDKLYKHQLLSIANSLSENPERTLGILTDNGEIDSDVKLLLEELRIPEDKIKIFTPNTIQGSEVDYFIFDIKYVSKFDSVRDKLKSFYTFTSRSKRGSIIIDSDTQNDQGFLERELNIVNEKKSLTTQEYEPLTEEVIKKAREDRKLKLEKLLNGKIELSQDSNFKWKMGKPKSDRDVKESLTEEVILPGLDIGFLPNSGTVKTPVQDASQDFSKKKNSIKASDFKLILYPFYKNANAIIKETKNKVKIQTNEDSLKSDLGFGNITLPADEFKTIEQEWLKMKNDLLNIYMNTKNKVFTIESANYSNFLAKGFGTDLDFVNTKTLNINIVVTASKYNPSIHDPYNKSLDDKTKHLNAGDLFLNLSAKIEYKGKTYYVTLAAFPSEKTLMSKGLDKVIDSERKDLSSKLLTSINKIKEDVKSGPKVYELNSELSYFTGVRLLRGEKGSKDEYPIIKLSDLKSRFKDADFSEIQLYPKDFDKFKELQLNNYFEYEGETLTDEELKIKYNELKNKPYIRVTFGDFKGSKMGKLISVYGIQRTIGELANESKKIIDEINDIVETKHANKEKLTIADFEKTNVISDMMTNRSNVLDLLIIWATTNDTNGNPLIDLLLEEHESKAKIFKRNKFSLLDVITRFKDTSDKDGFNPTKQLKYIVNAIKEEVSKNPKASSAEIKKSLLTGVNRSYFLSKWNDGFHNLFVYEDVIKSKSEHDLNLALFKFFGGATDLNDVSDATFEEFIEDDTLYKGLAKTAETLITSVPKTTKFYYSLPIISKNNEIKVNPMISGKSGFSDSELFGKLFVRTIVEAPNILATSDILLNLGQEIDEDTPNKETKEDTREPEISEDSIDLDEDVNPFQNINGWKALHTYIEGNFKFDPNSTLDNNVQKNRIQAYLNIFEIVDEFINVNSDNLSENLVGQSVLENILYKLNLLYDIDSNNFMVYNNLASIFSELEEELGIESISKVNESFFNDMLNERYENESLLVKDLGSIWLQRKREIINNYNKIC